MTTRPQIYRLADAAQYHPGLTVGTLRHLQDLYRRADYPGIWGTGCFDFVALTRQLAKDDGLPEDTATGSSLHSPTSFAAAYPGTTRNSLYAKNDRARRETATVALRRWRPAFIRYGKRGLLIVERQYLLVEGFDVTLEGPRGRLTTRRETEQLVATALRSRLTRFRLDPARPPADQILELVPRLVARELTEAGYYRPETNA